MSTPPERGEQQSAEETLNTVYAMEAQIGREQRGEEEPGVCTTRQKNKEKNNRSRSSSPIPTKKDDIDNAEKKKQKEEDEGPKKAPIREIWDLGLGEYQGMVKDRIKTAHMNAKLKAEERLRRKKEQAEKDASLMADDDNAGTNFDWDKAYQKASKSDNGGENEHNQTEAEMLEVCKNNLSRLPQKRKEQRSLYESLLDRVDKEAPEQRMVDEFTVGAHPFLKKAPWHLRLSFNQLDGARKGCDPPYSVIWPRPVPAEEEQKGSSKTDEEKKSEAELLSKIQILELELKLREMQSELDVATQESYYANKRAKELEIHLGVQSAEAAAEQRFSHWMIGETDKAHSIQRDREMALADQEIEQLRREKEDQKKADEKKWRREMEDTERLAAENARREAEDAARRAAKETARLSAENGRRAAEEEATAKLAAQEDARLASEEASDRRVRNEHDEDAEETTVPSSGGGLNLFDGSLLGAVGHAKGGLAGVNLDEHMCSDSDSEVM